MTSLSVPLVSQHGIRPAHLSGVDARLIRDPHDIRSGDDVVLFYGADMARQLRHFSTGREGALPPAVVLAPRLDWDDVFLALDHGATGYLLENRYAYLLAEALLCASRGVCILDPVIAADQLRTASEVRGRGRGRVQPGTADGAAVTDRRSGLSRRERQVMDLLASGHGVRDIARTMFLTDKTVRNYLNRIYAKLNVHCRSEAILYWLGHLDAPASRLDGKHTQSPLRTASME